MRNTPGLTIGLAIGLAIACALGVCQAASVAAPALETPVRTLSAQELQGIVALNGDWKFTDPEGLPHIVKVPGPWEKLYQRRFSPHFGKGVYVLRLQLPEQAMGQYFKLFTPIVGGNFGCYVDGQLRGHNGQKPGSSSRLVQFSPFKLERRQLELRCEVENHYINTSGLIRPLYFGPAEMIDSRQLKEKIGFNLFVGIFCFLGLFHLLLYAGFRQDKTLLWFGLFCLALALFGDLYHVRNLEYFFGDFPAGLTARLSRLSVFAVMAFYFLYAAKAAPADPDKPYLPPGFVKATLWLALGFSLSQLLPLRLATYGLIAWTGAILGQVLYSLYRLRFLLGHRPALPFLLSSLIFVLTLLNDLLNGVGLLSNGHYARYGVLIFCLLQAVFLALRLQNSYQQTLKLQHELTEVNQNLESLISMRTHEIQAKNEALTSLVSFKDEMTRMIVHDLKAPLNTLINLPLQQSGLSAGSHRSFQSASRRLVSLVENMLQIKQVESPALELQLRPESLQSLCAGVLLSVENWAQSKKIRLANEVEAGLTIRADDALLERVLLNLCDNAIKHTPIGGRICLSSHCEGDLVELRVHDSGPGLRPEALQRAFEQHQSFAQGDNPRSSGLGLYFCRQVIEAHSGQISLENAAAGGCLVRVRLPLQQAQLVAPAPFVREAAQAQQLLPLVERMQSIEVYDIMPLQEILTALRAIEDPHIRPWSDALAQAIKEVDETAYRDLIDQVTAALAGR